MTTGLASLAVAVAAGLRATIQTGQVSDSVLLEWWCVATARADKKISTRHNNATAFLATRISETSSDSIQPRACRWRAAASSSLLKSSQCRLCTPPAAQTPCNWTLSA